MDPLSQWFPNIFDSLDLLGYKPYLQGYNPVHCKDSTAPREATAHILGTIALRIQFHLIATKKPDKIKICEPLKSDQQMQPQPGEVKQWCSLGGTRTNQSFHYLVCTGGVQTNDFKSRGFLQVTSVVAPNLELDSTSLTQLVKGMLRADLEDTEEVHHKWFSLIARAIHIMLAILG